VIVGLQSHRRSGTPSTDALNRNPVLLSELTKTVEQMGGRLAYQQSIVKEALTCFDAKAIAVNVRLQDVYQGLPFIVTVNEPCV
jgi:hypothetical protein